MKQLQVGNARLFAAEKINRCFSRRNVLTSALLLSLSTTALPALADHKTMDLPQGWDEKTRSKAHHISFGSRLLPYDWLLNLEVADSSERVLSEKNTSALGFIHSHKSVNNPDGLPVGFTRDIDGDGRAWMGLGCAACHTGELSYQGTNIRIDGGAALINFTAFENTVVKALEATLNDTNKFNRFSQALNTSSNDQKALKSELKKRFEKLNQRHELNATEVPYGAGRLDAFGQIFNAVAVDLLEISDNKHTPDAPVSFPVLWDTAHLDVVQWNGSAPNFGPGPLIQNVTTALAVYGTAEVNGYSEYRGYPSSVNFKNMANIQNWVYDLKSPQWPTNVLGNLDEKRVARGEPLYQQNCVSCHELVDRNDDKRKLKAVLTPLNEIGTDPKMVNNFLSAKSQTGSLKGEKVMILAGDKMASTAPTIDLVMHVALGATVRHPFAATKAAVKSYHSVYKAPINQHPNYYKARPLTGIWSSAPFLHNGSVPNLYQLLLPPEKRVKEFYVSSREFDPVNVGLVSTKGPDNTLFDTRLTGNSNSGHLYGTQLNDESRLDLIEYLKSL